MPSVAAIDVGASSGRVICIELDGLRLTQLHRFATPWKMESGYERWDFAALVDEIRTGLAKAPGIASAGVDTWGVDFGLLDSDGKLLANPIRYRDGSHQDGFDELRKRVRYEWTGIQPWPFNTAAQLLARRMRDDQELMRAEQLMFMPDLVTRELARSQSTFAERTIASTSELLGLDGMWNANAREAAEVDEGLLPSVVDAGYRCEGFVAVGAHDTASAVAATPLAEDSVFISSGTWSLVGIESLVPHASDAALAAGFSNERGIEGTFRFLRNVMGLWLLHGCQGERDINDCIEMAKRGQPFAARFDTSHPSLLNPVDMVSEIRKIATAPIEDEATLFRCILENLASAYAEAVVAIARITGKRLRSICIVGGGSQNEMLNQMTADATGLPVFAGPVEATALGNALSQFASLGLIDGARREGRELVLRHFAQASYKPNEHERWREWLRR